MKIMRRFVLVLAVVTLVLAGCGGGSGFVEGTVDNTVALTFKLGMSESDVKHGLHGAPLDTFWYPLSLEEVNPGGECIYYRGVNKSPSKRFTATGSEWMFCFEKNKLAKLLRTCAARWTNVAEFDRYKDAGYSYYKGRYHGNATDCRH